MFTYKARFEKALIMLVEKDKNFPLYLLCIYTFQIWESYFAFSIDMSLEH